MADDTTFVDGNLARFGDSSSPMGVSSSSPSVAKDCAPAELSVSQTVGGTPSFAAASPAAASQASCLRTVATAASVAAMSVAHATRLAAANVSVSKAAVASEAAIDASVQAAAARAVVVPVLEYLLEGELLERKDLKPLRGARIEAWDAGGHCGDILGASTTDARGRFTLAVQKDAVAALVRDRRPTLGFRVFLPNGTAVAPPAWQWTPGSAVSRARLEVDLRHAAPNYEPSKHQVRGVVRDSSRMPLEGVVVRAFDVGFPEPVQLGEDAATDTDGTYCIVYSPATSQELAPEPELVVKAFAGSPGVASGDDKELAASPRYARAHATMSIDLVVGGQLRRVSRIEQAVASLAPVLGNVAIDGLAAETLDRVASRSRVNRGDAGHIAAGARLASALGIPSDVAAAISMSDIPIDVPSLLTRHPRDVQAALASALAANHLGADRAWAVTATLNQVKAKVIDYALGAVSGSKTPLGIVVTSALADDIDASKLFLTRHIEHDGTAAEFWDGLRSCVGLDAPATIARLKFAFGVAFATVAPEVCPGVEDPLRAALKAPPVHLDGAYHAPLVTAALAGFSLSAGSAARSLKDIARFSEADWTALVASAGAPIGTPGSTVDARNAWYRGKLRKRVRRAFATAAIASDLTRAPVPGAPDLGPFFADATDFEFGRTRVAHYFPLAGADASDKEMHLKAIERLDRLVGDPDDVGSLYRAGIGSAAQVLQTGKDGLVALGLSVPRAEELVALACGQSGAAVAIQASYMTMLGGQFKPPSGLAADIGAGVNANKSARVAHHGFLAGMTPAKDLPEPIADWNKMFNDGSACMTERCSSVHGPAAYLVELLQFIRGISSTLARQAPAKGTFTALDLLFGTEPGLLPRRLDIAKVDLNCSNTNVAVPYIDLVNEVLEHVVAARGYPSHISVTDDADALRAAPEVLDADVRDTALAALAAEDAPLSAPFQYWLLEARTFARAQDLSLEDAVGAFQRGYGGVETSPLSLPASAKPCFTFMPPAYPAEGPAARVRIGVSDRFERLTLAVDAVPTWRVFGYDAPAPAAWATDLLFASTFMARTGLSFDELTDLLGGAVVRRFAKSGEAGPGLGPNGPVETCKLEDLIIQGLDPAKLLTCWDVVARFLRLQRHLGWSINDLDMILSALYPASHDADQPFLTDPRLIAKLSAIADLRSRGVAAEVIGSWLGGFDTIARGGPSFYDRLFQNPALTKPVDPALAFKEVNKNGIVEPLGVHEAAVRAAAQVTARELAALASEDELGSNPVLSAANLLTVYRNATLARHLGLTVDKYVTLKRLMGAYAGGSNRPDPFCDPAGPALYRIAAERVARSTLAIEDAAFVFRGERVPGTAVAALATWPQVARTLRGRLEEIRAAAAVLSDPDGAVLFGSALMAPAAFASLDELGGVVGDYVKRPAWLGTDDDRLMFAVRVRCVVEAWFDLPNPTAGASAREDACKFAGWWNDDAHDADWTAIFIWFQCSLRPLLGPSNQGGALSDMFVEPNSGETFERDVRVRRTSVARVLRRLVDGDKAIVQALATACGISPAESSALLESPMLPAGAGDPEFAGVAVQHFRLEGGAFEPAAVDAYQPFEQMVKASALVRALALPVDDMMVFLGDGVVGADIAGLVSLKSILPLSREIQQSENGHVTLRALQGEHFRRWLLALEVAEGWSRICGTASLRDALRTSGVEFLGAIASSVTAPAHERAAIVTEVTALAALQNEETLAPNAQGERTQLVARIMHGLGVARRFGVRGDQMAGWSMLASAPQGGQQGNAQAAALRAIADGVVRAAKARFDADTWPDVAEQARVSLREAERDALCQRVLRGGKLGDSLDDLFSWLLLDVEAGAELATSRIKLAISGVQNFVQRIALGLERYLSLNQEQVTRWKWLRHFTVWEAARKVFLFPENWMEPALRDDKTPLFRELESRLRRQELTDESAEQALTAYLDSFIELSDLEVVAVLREEGVVAANGVSTNVVHVVGRTHGLPKRYYYRNRTYSGWTTVRSFEAKLGVWSPWERVDLDIDGDHIILATAFGRLYLMWATLEQKPDTQQPPRQAGVKSEDPAPRDLMQLEVGLSVSERRAGQWTPPMKSNDTVVAARESARELLEPALVRLEVSPGGSSGFLVRLAYPILADSIIYGAVSVEGASNVEPAPLEAIGALPSKTYDPGSFWRYRAQFFVNVARGLVHAAREQSPVLTPAPVDVKVVPSHWSRSGQTMTSAPQQGTGTLQTDDGPLFALLPVGTRLVAEVKSGAKLGTFVLQAPGGTYVCDRAPETSKTYARSMYSRYALGMLRRLRLFGVNGFFGAVHEASGWTSVRDLQVMLNQTVFAGLGPLSAVKKLDDDDVGFGPQDPYGAYHWEIFFHIPLLVATRLAAARRYEDAEKWFRRLFDPSISPDGPDVKGKPWSSVPQRFWMTKPLFGLKHFVSIQQEMLELAESKAKASSKDAKILAALDSLNIDSRDVSEMLAGIQAWLKDPFSPYAVARTRPVAFQKQVVLKYVSMLLSWADDLFRRDTLEDIAQATQIYVLAKDLLGARPPRIPRLATPEPVAAGNFQQIDAFGNALVEAEAITPAIGYGPCVGGNAPPRLLTLFTVPGNDRLIALWDTVADRLFKIRHSMNIAGVTRTLALFEPPIDPALLVEAAAAGVDLESIMSELNSGGLPIRYASIYPEAVELATAVSGLGGALLSALEKGDGEALARLRASHEVAALNAGAEVKKQAVKEARAALDACKRARDTVVARRDHYAGLIAGGLNGGETAAIALQVSAALVGTTSSAMRMGAAPTRAIPEVVVGGAGIASPVQINVITGGQKAASAVEDFASGLDIVGRWLDAGGHLAAMMAGYDRRGEEWQLQLTLANRELADVDKRIAAAECRLALAGADIALHDLQRSNAREADDFIRHKLSNEELYEWMADQATEVYFQSYKLAYDVARRAERAMRTELALDDDVPRYVSFGYWDSARRGLFAGERLLADLRAMNVAYHERNCRELEITKHVALSEVDPDALLRIRSGDPASVVLPEALFVRDYPGHYLRRLRSVAITVAGVGAPYGGVCCTLRLKSSQVRVKPLADDAALRTYHAAVESIVTSGGQSDAGLFEVNLKDERYLPFEGAGAADSEWEITIPGGANNIELMAIADVVLHLRYTARDGGAKFAADMVTAPLSFMTKPARVLMFDAERDLPDIWAAWKGGAQTSLLIEVNRGHFAVSNVAGAKVTSVEVYATGESGAPTKAQFTWSGGDPVLMGEPGTGKFAHWRSQELSGPSIGRGQARTLAVEFGELGQGGTFVAKSDAQLHLAALVVVIGYEPTS